MKFFSLAQANEMSSSFGFDIQSDPEPAVNYELWIMRNKSKKTLSTQGLLDD